MITYGNVKFEKSKKRLTTEAENTGWFSSIVSYGPEDLDDEFKLKFEEILNKPRIGGYGIWRPYIIKKKLEEISYNDILIYLDAGCKINSSGKKRFNEYIELLNKSDEGIISFQLGHIEKRYTTKEIFDYFDVNMRDKIANSGQILSGILIMKKNTNLIKLIDKWLRVVHDNPLLFTDHYNNNQAPPFRDNRHEQSVFSLIRKLSNPILLRDETYFRPFGNEVSLTYPFWATRIRK